MTKNIGNMKSLSLSVNIVTSLLWGIAIGSIVAVGPLVFAYAVALVLGGLTIPEFIERIKYPHVLFVVFAQGFIFMAATNFIRNLKKPNDFIKSLPWVYSLVSWVILVIISGEGIGNIIIIGIFIGGICFPLLCLWIKSFLSGITIERRNKSKQKSD